MPTKKEWTVLFLIKSVVSADMTKLISVLKELEEIVFEPKISILLGINFDRRNLKALMQLDERLIVDGENVQFTTMFFSLGRRNEYDKNKPLIIGEKGDFDITNPVDVEGFFKKSILSKNKAKKYLLFTWDHGDGYGIFESIGPKDQSLPRPKVKPVLTMDELSVAITRAFGKKKVDLMIMMNCNMQMFDTAYSFRKNVKFLVAPQTDMESDHYDYHSIFSRLARFPEIDGKLLSRMTVLDFKTRESEISDDLSISACDLSSVERIVDLLDELAILYFRRLEAQGFNDLKEKFGETETVERSKKFVDLYSLLNQLRLLKNSAEQQVLDQLIPLSYGMIIEFCTYLKTCDKKKYKCHYGSSVITPFVMPIPRKSLTDDKIQDAKKYIKYTQFRQQTGWGQLMNFIEDNGRG